MFTLNNILTASLITAVVAFMVFQRGFPCAFLRMILFLPTGVKYDLVPTFVITLCISLSAVFYGYESLIGYVVMLFIVAIWKAIMGKVFAEA